MERTFSGGIFSDTLDGGRAGAVIELSPSGISARTPDGESFLISYRDCQVEVGGFSGRMVFCRNPDRSLTIFCEDRKFPDALSYAGSGILDGQVREGLRQCRSESRRGTIIGTAVLLGIAALVVVSYFAIRAGARAAVQALPVRIDRELGSAAFKSMDLGGPEVTDEVVVGAMNSIVDRLAPQAAIEGMEFDVHVVDSPAVNAFCLPGGTIVVFTGLIHAADDAEQVAGVLGHEISHATLRHGLERIGQSLGLWTGVTLLLGDTGGLTAAAVDLFQVASINSYSHEQENAADLESVRMLHAAGVDPLGLAGFFETLKEQQGDLPVLVSWISTHPHHAARIANVKTEAAALPQREFQPLEIDWPSVHRRINKPD
jgi:predicted Zn-dependent protease